jgi:hypothetical protein
MSTTTQNPDCLTIWDKPNDQLNTQYGRITYLDWCEREASRLTASGTKAHVAKSTTGKVCVKKVKAKCCCAPVWECDINGKAIN